MKPEIKQATIKHFYESIDHRFNFVNHRTPALTAYTVDHYIGFDLDYWEDIYGYEIKEIIEAVETLMNENSEDIHKFIKEYVNA